MATRFTVAVTTEKDAINLPEAAGMSVCWLKIRVKGCLSGAGPRPAQAWSKWQVGDVRCQDILDTLGQDIPDTFLRGIEGCRGESRV